MYSYLWKLLPGNTIAKIVQSIVLLAAIVVILFKVVFPVIMPLLPIDDGTLEGPEVVSTP